MRMLLGGLPMSDLPDRDAIRRLRQYFTSGYGREDYDRAIVRVLDAVADGRLKSRDEMNEEAAARRWMEDDEHTPYYMPYSEAVKNLLDAAWGVADEDS